MFRLVGAGFLVSLMSGAFAEDQVLNLNLKNDPAVEKVFGQVYDKFLKDFDIDTYTKMMEDLELGLENYKNSAAYTAYKTIPNQPMCDKGAVSPAMKKVSSVKGMTPFPGGMLGRVFGFDLGKYLFELSSKASGPASSSASMLPLLQSQALSMGASMIQSIVSTAVMVVPRAVPPFQPLSCVPMVTGHNCFGAVLYPITMSDFVIADVTDSMLDSYLSGFPTNYLNKVGKTSDAAYKLCASSYMGMQCASLFPRCNSAQAESTPAPVMGRTPMCFHQCLSTLVFCPGFWIEDIMGPCQNVAPPPMCAMSVWFNYWRLPAQYVSYEDSHPSPLECPQTDLGFSADSDYGLYDEDSQAITSSPYISSGASKLPSA